MNPKSDKSEEFPAAAEDTARNAAELAAAPVKAKRRAPKLPPSAVEGGHPPANSPSPSRPKKAKTGKGKSSLQGRLFPEDDVATSATGDGAVEKLPSAELAPEGSIDLSASLAQPVPGQVNPAEPDQQKESSPTRPEDGILGRGTNTAADEASVDAALIAAAQPPNEKGAAVCEQNMQEFRERDARIVFAAKVNDQPEFWFINAGRDLDEMERKKLYRVEKFATLEEYHSSRKLLMQTTGHWRKLARGYDEMVSAGYTPPTMKAVHFEAVAGLSVARKFEVLTAASMNGRITKRRIECEIAKMLAAQQPSSVEPSGLGPLGGAKTEIAGHAPEGIRHSGDKTQPDATNAGAASTGATSTRHPGGNAARRATPESVQSANSGRSPEFRSVDSFSEAEFLKCKAMFSAELTNQLLKMRQIAEAAAKRVGIHRYDAIEFFEKMMKT